MFIRRGTLRKNFGMIGVSIVLTMGIVGSYLYGVSIQNELNVAWTSGDQKAYVNFVREVSESDFTYTGQRNRMPLFPYIQALAYSPSLDDDALFERGKQVNTVISVISLAVFGVLLFWQFSKLYAVYSILMIAFLCFIFKAPYFQTEILFYALMGLAFILSLNVLVEPRWVKAVGTGVLFALAHLAKASAIVGLAITIVSFMLLLGIKLFFKTEVKASFMNILACIILPPLVFVIVLFPYLKESKAIYGQYFYNVNTTFYIWYDSWEEAKEGTRAAGDRVGYPDMPADEIPSLGKYVSEHTLDEMIGRLTNGLSQIHFSISQSSGYAYGYYAQFIAFILFIIIALIVRLKTFSWHVIIRNLHIIGFVLAFFVAYTLAYAWYMPLIGTGVRTILSLLIPLVWVIGLILHFPQLQLWYLSIHDHRLKVVTLFQAVMLVSIVLEIYYVFQFRLGVMSGSN